MEDEEEFVDRDTRRVPQDLVPLPTMPYSERPPSLPLVVDECRTAIWRARGNVTQAAEILKIPSLRLRAFIRKSPFLSEELREATEQIVDIAEGVVVEALTDDADKSRRDQMARFVLGNQGKGRGWGAGADNKVTINNHGGKVVVGWDDGQEFAPRASSDGYKTIEGDVVDAA